MKLEFANGFNAWPQGIVCLCKRNYGVHMVLNNGENFLKALGNYY